MPRQQYVLTVVTDDSFPHKRNSEAANIFAGRVWNMDGVSHADCEVMGDDVVVVPRVQYEQLKFRVEHEKLAVMKLDGTDS